MEKRLQRWRLILGQQADPQAQVPLESAFQGMDDTLEALYDSNRNRGLGDSAPSVNRWLGDIRKYFPTPVVQLLQKDALERLGLRQMLLEKELLASIEPDIHLVSALLSLSKVIPANTRETARQIVRKFAQDLEKRLRNPLLQAIRGSLRQAQFTRRPRAGDIDWRRTIRANLKHYQPDYQTIIPEKLIGYRRQAPHLRRLVLLIDQSGSMANSVVYAGILGAILASLRSIKTHVVVFDTNVADLSHLMHDPVELLFATQLGGGTDIGKALAYAAQLIQAPHDTILVLLSDLMEGASESDMLNRMAGIKASGVQVISLLSLSDTGTPAYDHAMAAQLAGLGIPAFACTPDRFPELMAAAIRKQDLRQIAGVSGLTVKN